MVNDATRAAEGFAPTCYPHLWRVKLQPLVDSQEYKQILDGIANTDSDRGAYNADITYYPGDIVTGTDGTKYEGTTDGFGKIVGVPLSKETNYEIVASTEGNASAKDLVSTTGMKKSKTISKIVYLSGGTSLVPDNSEVVGTKFKSKF